MSDLVVDLRHSLRALARSPSFTLGVIAILALGLGANILIFSVFDTVVLRPMGFAEPERLCYVWPEHDWFSKREVLFFQEASTAVDSAAYYRWSNHTLLADGKAEMLNASLVTANFFSVLGVQPIHGRTFVDGEDQPGAERVIVLSYGFWQRRFGGDPGIVGQTIQLDSLPTTVVGVMPRGFSFRAGDRELWIPFEMDPAQATDFDSRYLQMVARLKHGVSREEAVAETQRVAIALWEETGKTRERPERLTLPKFQDMIVGGVRPMLVWLLIAVGSLLLISSVNVANLLLTRSAGRGREIAIRAALGCGRGRLAVSLLAENVVLALAGGTLGFFAARLGLAGLIRSLPDGMPRTDEIAIDGRVALAGLALSVLTGLACGAAPAISLARKQVFGLLREGSGSVGGRSRLRGILVVAEVALAVVLVTAAGLAARSFYLAAQVDPGFQPDGVFTFAAMISDKKYEDRTTRTAFYHDLQERLAATSGVEAVGAIHMLPIRQQGYNGFLDVEGRDVPLDKRPIVNWRVVTPGYFETLAIPRVKGRLLDGRDHATAMPTALVNETFAERYLDGVDPVGQRIRTSVEEGSGWLTVVGVMGDIHQNGLTTDVRPEVYRLLDQVERHVGMTFVVRSGLDSAELARIARATVTAVDPNVPVALEDTMASVLRNSLTFQRLILTLAAIFAGLAMVLGAAGIYGVVAFDVGRRTPEIGLRMALGARRGGVLRLILRQGMAPVSAGLVAGTALSLGLGRFVESLLFEVQPGDPTTYAAMLAILGGVALLAVYVPAWRASRVEPLVALRYE